MAADEDGPAVGPAFTPDGGTLYLDNKRDSNEADNSVHLIRRVPKVSPASSSALTAVNAALQFDGDDLVEFPSFSFDPLASYASEGFVTSPLKADEGAGLACGMPEQSSLWFPRVSHWRWLYAPRREGRGVEIAIAGAPAPPSPTHFACVRHGQTHRL